MNDDFYDLFSPPPAASTATVTPLHAPPGSATSYAAAALRREAETVAGTAEGQRNATLNKAYFNMGRHVGAGNIDLADVRATLADAARTCGLPEREIDTVLRVDNTSAAHAGQELPRHPAPLPDLPTPTVLVDPESVGPLLNPIIDWSELFAADDDGEEWIVEPLLPARRMVALYSAPKAGKSLLMLEVAAAIARGVPVLGATPDRARRVLYVDFENDPRGDIRTRLEAMELGPDDLDGLCYLTYPSLAKFDTAAGAGDLMRHVEHYACEVVVIDTVGRAVMGEENDNDTWLALYRHTGLALKQAGVACIRLDHSGKDREKGMRGGSAKYGDADAVWRLTALNETTILLECTDHRMPIPTKTLTLVRQDFPLSHVPAGEAWQAAMDAKADRVDQELDALGVPCSASWRDAGKALREAGNKVENRALREAVKHRKMRLDLSASDPVAPGPAAHSGPLRPTGESGPRPTTPVGGGRPISGPQPGPPTDDPETLVSCTNCHKPTTQAVASNNDGRCATCHRDTQEDA